VVITLAVVVVLQRLEKTQQLLAVLVLVVLVVQADSLALLVHQFSVVAVVVL
jgi:hypothetical protein